MALFRIPDSLAVVDFQNPVLWAVLIGWVLSVVLHELAHGVVAYLGGDYTIRERGGLTLNPLQYVHPVNSIGLPLVLLLMGGLPLPGGATYVRRDLLRHRAWETAVSLAGPVVNVALFAVLILPLHPAFRWLAPGTPPNLWSPAQQCLGTLATLQLVTAALNLLPLPPLDGFNAIAPWLGRHVQDTLSTPVASTAGLVLVFALLVSVRHAIQPIWDAQCWMLDRAGMGDVLEPLRAIYNGLI